MFDFHQDALKDLRDFMSSHNEALQNASLLLGGQPALRRTQVLLGDLMNARSLTRRREIQDCSTPWSSEPEQCA